MSPELIELQKRVDAARLAKARAEAAYEKAQELREEALQKLKSEYGIDNLDEVRAKLTELRSLAEQEMKQVAQVLDKLE